jgi:lipoate-protein ligase B
MPQTAWICDLGRADYATTAQLQRSLRAAREAGAIPDTLLVLEHDPVITTGYRTEPHEVAYARTLPLPVVPTERGGKATYHGPGQIVLYPVMDLRDHGQDVRAFVRGLEQALINTLQQYGIPAGRQPEYPGVWVDGRKIASIGIRVTSWVAFHGIALNVSCDLKPFGWFTPCGIEGVAMTSMAVELGEEHVPPLGAVRESLVDAVCVEFGLGARPVDRDDVLIEAAAYPVPAPELPEAVETPDAEPAGPVATATAPAPDTGTHTLVVEARS